MTHLKHDHKSKPQGQQMPVETSEMTLTISKLRVPYKNKRSVLFTHAATHIFQVFTVIIGRAYNWKGIFKIDSAFTAFKRNTAFQTRYAEVVPFGNRRYTSCESGPFSVGSDGIWKVTGLDLRVENPRTPLPPPPAVFNCAECPPANIRVMNFLSNLPARCTGGIRRSPGQWKV